MTCWVKDHCVSPTGTGDSPLSNSIPQAADPGVCGRCAAQGDTCCKLAPGNEEFCFPLSIYEKERIQEVMPDEGLFVLEPNSKAFVDNVCRLFPEDTSVVHKLFPPHGDHFRLATDSTGTCRFLNEDGCVLHREIRPYYCRLYPFWMQGNKITVFDSATCLLRREALTIGTMLKHIGMSVEEVRDLFGRLRLAWGLPPEPGGKPVKRGF